MSKFFDAYKRMYQDAAFAVWKGDGARVRANNDAIEVIYQFMDGKETRQSVKDALECLIEIHGEPVKKDCLTIACAIEMENYFSRVKLIDACLGRITKYLRRSGALKTRSIERW